MGSGKQKNHGEVAQTSKDLLYKMLWNKDGKTFTIGTERTFVNKLACTNNSTIMRMGGLLYCIDSVTAYI